MSKTLFAVLLAAGLFAAPLPALMQNAAAQTTAPEKKQAKIKKPPTPGQLAARERLEEVRRRMERGQGRRQDREGNEVAEILERVQQAAQDRRLSGTLPHFKNST